MEHAARKSPLFVLLAVLLTTGCNNSGSPTIPVSAAALSTIQVTPSDAVASLGETRQLKAVGAYSDGTTKDITSSTYWSSSDTAVARIGGTGLLVTAASGTTTITARSGEVSDSILLTVTTGSDPQPPINITLDLHCDPLNQHLTLDERRAFFRKQMDNAVWLLDLADLYGFKVSYLAVGECYEFCMEDSEKASCLPVLARLKASGGILATHQHTEYYRGPHDWPSIANAYTNPAPADVRKVWDTNKLFTDNAIRQALGLTDPADIAAVNTAAESHVQLQDPNQMMEEYGYSVREGGADQVMATYFSHVPWNPFRPGVNALTEDLNTSFVTIPQGMVIGHTGEHLGLWQDGTSQRKKAEFLQLYANRKERIRMGAIPKVWSFGMGVHTQDLDTGSAARAAIADFFPWLVDEFVSKASGSAAGSARFASYIDVRDEYLAWEAAHPAISSFNYPSTTRDYTIYPYLEQANRFLRFARFESRIAAAGVEAFLLKAGDYSAASPAAYSLVLAYTDGAAASTDLSGVLGPGTLKQIRLQDGYTTDAASSGVKVSVEPILLCAPDACDSILALEHASAGGSCGAGSACTAGKVCAAALGMCVPDCRIPGNTCPLSHPNCQETTGLCS